MIVGIRFQLNESLFNKDPQDTDLGKKILEQSIILINELGIESFNFKKLAEAIDSTEASIYRYFENKHKLLLFLTSWYWQWVQYLIEMNTKNIDDPKKLLAVAINNIVNASTENPLTSYVNENLLHNIIVKESSKAYHTNTVDKENEGGLFLSYKNLVEKLSQMIAKVDKDFPYKTSLASNIFEMSNNQMYFAQHLPRLTDIKNCPTRNEDLEKMICYFVFKLLD